MDGSLASPERLVLYDGVCGLCDRTVQFLLDHDREGKLHYATLEGPTASAVLARHPELVGVDSVIFVEKTAEGEQAFVRSRAVAALARHLDGGAKALVGLRFLPRFLADAAYDLVARSRYRIFGKLDQCRVPTPDVRARFLP